MKRICNFLFDIKRRYGRNANTCVGAFSFFFKLSVDVYIVKVFGDMTDGKIRCKENVLNNV